MAAVEQGRVIFDNLRKFVKFSLCGNIGKIMVVMIGALLGMPGPLLPLQLLWLNLLADGLLGVGLGVEPAERGVMQRAPISAGASVFANGVGGQIMRMGLLIGAVSLGMGAYHYFTVHEDWRTMMFTTLALAQVWRALGTRTGTDSLFARGLLGNTPLLLLAMLVVVAQLLAVYTPDLNDVLKTNPLELADLLLCVGASALVFGCAKLEKIVLRRNASHVKIR